MRSWYRRRAPGWARARLVTPAADRALIERLAVPDPGGKIERAVVLARRDAGTAYHLAVVVDDAAQGVTEVVRGADLFGSTPIQILIQRLLGLPTPAYHHHRLVRDDAGRRLAKRDDARAIRRYREDGASPADIRAMLGL